ncbi:unnamed protein product [Larinioides sclopetarius]|uniref:Uncharacterized protein n=1 Tax=Larinioides sclopetarius TaxID=280406 RepID=A0AAV2BEH9_9ARAC
MKPVTASFTNKLAPFNLGLLLRFPLQMILVAAQPKPGRNRLLTSSSDRRELSSLKYAYKVHWILAPLMRICDSGLGKFVYVTRVDYMGRAQTLSSQVPLIDLTSLYDLKSESRPGGKISSSELEGFLFKIPVCPPGALQLCDRMPSSDYYNFSEYLHRISGYH